MSAPLCRGPHDVPNLRLYLMDKWRTGGVYEMAARMQRRAWQLAPQEYHAREEADWQRRHLKEAQLWWVGRDMVDEISHVANELPADVKPADVPGLLVDDGDATRGLVILEKTLTGTDAVTGDPTLRIDGFVYGGTRLPPLHGKPFRQAVSFAPYRRVNYDDGMDPEDTKAAAGIITAEVEVVGRPGGTRVNGDNGPAFLLHGDEWLPLGRSDWPVGAPLSEPVDSTVPEATHASMMEDRRWLAALLLVAADHRVAKVTRAKPGDRHLRRPSERKGVDPTVRIVYLRALEAPKEATGTPGARKPPKAHIVRSHPRWQAWGPERSLRKLIIVPRHARGYGENPEEGPPTVKAVVR